MDVILIVTCSVENVRREGTLIIQNCKQQGHEESTELGRFLVCELSQNSLISLMYLQKYSGLDQLGL